MDFCSIYCDFIYQKFDSHAEKRWRCSINCNNSSWQISQKGLGNYCVHIWILGNFPTFNVFCVCCYHLEVSKSFAIGMDIAYFRIWTKTGPKNVQDYWNCWTSSWWYLKSFWSSYWNIYVLAVFTIALNKNEYLFSAWNNFQEALTLFSVVLLVWMDFRYASSSSFFLFLRRTFRVRFIKNSLVSAYWMAYSLVVFSYSPSCK